jgi:hypothetical protein
LAAGIPGVDSFQNHNDFHVGEKAGLILETQQDCHVGKGVPERGQLMRTRFSIEPTGGCHPVVKRGRRP